MCKTKKKSIKKPGDKIRFKLKTIGGILEDLEAEGEILSYYSRDHYKVLLDGNILVVEQAEVFDEVSNS